MNEVSTFLPVVEISIEDLPVYCSNPKTETWGGHPRVFIDITHGEASCPYCGTRYRLKEGSILKHQH
ncbi:zinc-finger domain-containing protein [Candidatus Pandoraea novymonadis]|uniref:Zinc finger CHCC-type domain-containing protein n=1 Tax=Candidatus Pandoraea novymonadis TaxID=1808959 RepID=A0ABX5FDE8_9BURK|nr:zinc-finger domain-containing protein [Candidatus Pandoraea novymonadis]PSB91791.1 hypothetical protein BZL35_00004 [Candidatus Pandoraea novymonadis]